MKELNEVLLRIKEIVESDGKHRFHFCEMNGEIRLSDVLNSIASVWNELDKEKQQDKISKLLLKEKPKHYLGDIKWVLYKHICDMEAPVNGWFTFRCGRFAFDRIKNISGKQIEPQENDFVFNLNGENIVVLLTTHLEKRQVIISRKFIKPDHEYYLNTDTEIYEDDIVLYYA